MSPPIWHRSFLAALALALTAACGADARGEDVGPGVPGDTGSGGDGGGGGDDGEDTKYDVDPGEGDEGDGVEVPATCENISEVGDTSIGCVFFAHAPNARKHSVYGPPPFGLGISVGNPSTRAAHIRIEDMRGPNETLRLMTEFDLDPKASRLTVLDGNNPPGLFPDEEYADDNSWSRPTEYGLSGFRITSDVPVTATQIFPVGGAKSYIPDASLLLPVNSLGTVYLGGTYDSPNGIHGSDNGWAIVVGTQDGTTITTERETFNLDAFEGRMLETDPDGNSGVTGFYVSGDAPFAMFTGEWCVNVPEVSVGTCDHLEEQMLPLATWGTKYVAARHPRRSPEQRTINENVTWRIVAGTDGVEIELTPPVPGVGDRITLEKLGDWTSFTTPDAFVAESDQPFMLLEFMNGSDALAPDVGLYEYDVGADMSGDPSMASMVAVEQWVETLPFLTDTSYDWDFVTIARELGTEVTLDCLGPISDDHFAPIPGTDYELGHVTLDLRGQGGEGGCVDGAQFLTATGPVGVVVGGVAYDASYLYPGGLKLETLWTPPPNPP